MLKNWLKRSGNSDVTYEAYAEFADYSFVPRIREFENMIILRTFSKAFGLAALRLGYAIANLELAKILAEKAPLPYPVSQLSLELDSKCWTTLT